MSKLRVAKATLIGVEECLADAGRRLRAGELGLPAVGQCLIDAIAFAQRGLADVEEATAEVVRALADAGVPPAADYQSRARKTTSSRSSKSPSAPACRQAGASRQAAASSQRKRRRR